MMLLAACGQSKTGLPTTPIAHSLPTLIQRTSTLVFTQTLEKQPSSTVSPTRISIQFPKDPTDTPNLDRTPLPTRTPGPTETVSPPGYSMLIPAYAGVTESPDGKWLWAIEYGQPEQDPETGAINYFTHIVRRDGKADWKVKLDKTYFASLGKSIPIESSYTPFYWLPNDPYVYLVGSACCIDDPIYFYTGMNLARLNLETGEVTIQVPGWKIHYFTFSENGKYLLDGNFINQKLTIYRLMTGQEIEILLPNEYSQSGDAAFSPDNKQFAIQTTVDNEQEGTQGLALLLVDIAARNYKVLVPNLIQAMGSDRVVRTQTHWTSDTQVELIEKVYSPEETPRRWAIDIQTGKFSEIN
jgi:hypothetical protein